MIDTFKAAASVALAPHGDWKRALIAALLCLCMILALGQQQSVQAQTRSPSENATPACMERTSRGGDTIAVILPRSNSKKLQAKGFKNVSCNKRFRTEAERIAYRDAICAIASSWRLELQAHFERVHGERPAVLCGMAEAAMNSQWKRKGGK